MNGPGGLRVWNGQGWEVDDTQDPAYDHPTLRMQREALELPYAEPCPICGWAETEPAGDFSEKMTFGVHKFRDERGFGAESPTLAMQGGCGCGGGGCSEGGDCCGGCSGGCREDAVPPTHHRETVDEDSVNPSGWGGVDARNDDVRGALGDLHDKKESMTDRGWEQWLRAVQLGNRTRDSTWQRSQADHSAWAFSTPYVADERFLLPSHPDCDLALLTQDGCSFDAPLVDARDSIARCQNKDDALDAPILTGLWGIEECGGDSRSLLRGAWCMLRENLDIVRWVSCVVFGRAELLEEMLRDPGFCGVTLGCANLDATAHSYEGIVAGTGYIAFDFDPGGPLLTRWACGSQADRLCAVIYVASELFHELAHIAWYNVNDVPHVGGACQTSYVGESTRRWALLQRFAGAGSSACCRGWYRNLDDEVLTDDVDFFSRRCDALAC